MMDLIPTPASQVGVQMERVNNYTVLSVESGTQLRAQHASASTIIMHKGRWEGRGAPGLPKATRALGTESQVSAQPPPLSDSL